MALNLRKWPLVLMRFIVEVAIHARAKSCTKLLIDNLQELLARDKSRESSVGLLMALSSRPELAASEDSAPDTNASTRRRFNAWLETTFFECPHGQFVFALRGIMKTMLASLSSKLEREWPEVQEFLKAEPMAASSASSDGESVESEARPLSPQDHASRFVDALPTDCLTSHLASFCDQLLTIVERSTADDVYFRDGESVSVVSVLIFFTVLNTVFSALLGFTAACDVLVSVVSIGSVGLGVLLRLRAMERLVYTILSLNPTRQQIPVAKLTTSFELASSTIKACFASVRFQQTSSQ